MDWGKTTSRFALFAIGSICLMSCNKGPTYEFTKKEPDFSSKSASNVMRIGAWVAPPPANWNGKGNPNFITQEAYNDVAESGINVIYSLYEHDNKEATKAALQYAENAGIKYLARDMNASVDPKAMELEPGEMHQATKSYDGSPALAGWLVQDEPNVDAFEKLGRLKEYYQTEYPGKEMYVNLFPTYANTSQLGVSSYKQYIDDYIRIVKPDFVSYDHYDMFQDGYGNKKLTEDVLWNLEIVATRCKKAGIPMYTFVQAMSYDGSTRVPNEQEIRHQVLTQIAYGSKSIQYFCYWTPLEFTQGSPSMITVDGQKTDIYNYVKTVNAELMNIDEAYLDFEWEGTLPIVGSEVRDLVKQYVMLEEPLESIDAIKSYSATQNTLISRYVNKEKVEAFMVMNFADPATKANDKVSIEFAGGSKALVYHKLEKKIVEFNNYKLELEIEPGDGYFIIPFEA